MMSAALERAEHASFMAASIPEAKSLSISKCDSLSGSIPSRGFCPVSIMNGDEQDCQTPGSTGGIMLLLPEMTWSVMIGLSKASSPAQSELCICVINQIVQVKGLLVTGTRKC